MQKLIKNWIFTLILCVLLVAFAVLLVLDVNGVTAERYYATVYVNLLAALALIIYIALVLAPMFAYYRGKALAFLIGEIILLAVTLLALFGLEFLDMFKDMQVGTVLGLAVWLRCSVLIVRAYLQQLQPQAELAVSDEAQAEPVAEAQTAEQSEEDSDKQARREARERKKKARTPLWLLCLLILLSAGGVWEIFNPMLESVVFVYCIAVLAAAFGVVLCVLTVQNYRARPKKEVAPEADAAETLPEAPAAEQLPETKQEALPEGEKKETEQPAAQNKEDDGAKDKEAAKETDQKVETEENTEK